MPRRDEPVPAPDPDDEDLPTIADDPPSAGSAVDDDAPTIDASAHNRQIPSGIRQSVGNVPVPTRPPSMAGMRTAPAAMPKPENLGETIETSRSAFDMMPANRPPTPKEYESTQYLISAVMPHPLAAKAPEPVVPRAMPVATPVKVAPPPVSLIVAAVVVVLMVIGAAIYLVMR